LHALPLIEGQVKKKAVRPKPTEKSGCHTQPWWRFDLQACITVGDWELDGCWQKIFELRERRFGSKHAS